MNKPALRTAIDDLIKAHNCLAHSRSVVESNNHRETIAKAQDKLDRLLAEPESLVFTCVEAEALMDHFNDTDTPQQLLVEFLPQGAVGDDDETNSVSPAGLYIRDLEAPEEGVIYLGKGDEDSVPTKYNTDNLLNPHVGTLTVADPVETLAIPDDTMAWLNDLLDGIRKHHDDVKARGLKLLPGDEEQWTHLTKIREVLRTTPKPTGFTVVSPTSPEYRQRVVDVLQTIATMIEAGAPVAPNTGLWARGDIYEGFELDCHIKLGGITPAKKGKGDAPGN